MSRVLVATGSTEFDQQAIVEALVLLGSDHEYLFLTVEHGVTRAGSSPVAGIRRIQCWSRKRHSQTPSKERERKEDAACKRFWTDSGCGSRSGWRPVTPTNR